MLKLNEQSLKWALKHVLRYGDTDVLPVPFEFDAIAHDWTRILDYLKESDVLDWKVRPHRNLLAPKLKYGFRIVTQLDPLDFLVFASLIYEIADEIEADRIPTTDEIVYSHRVGNTNDGQLFDLTIGYENFRRRTNQLLQSKNYSYVAVTDIADFYPRIYSHRLEGALNGATSRSNHVKAIMRLLSGWNGTESFGIPVGNQPSRLLAESVLIDVDAAMLAAGVRFVRFNDDYRIFAGSRSQAYRHLAHLADVLYRNHGLSLQPQKTTIWTSEAYATASGSSPEEREVNALYEKFQELIDELGLPSRYTEIDYEDLTEDQRDLVDSLNLQALFREEIAKSSPDFAVIRFVLRRLGQLGDSSIVDESIDHIEELYPVFPDIIEYLSHMHDLDDDQYETIGESILAALGDSILSELKYHQMWGLALFAGSTRWNQSDHFFQMLAGTGDPFVRRKLILAMGRAHQRHWFQTQWRDLFNESPWTKRAIIAAASCLTTDARTHWYRSIQSRLDPLELAVMSWAKANPF